MNFTEKEVLRAKRDLKNIIDDIFSSSGITAYPVNLKRLINLLENNNVLRIISKPYFEMKINFNEIEVREYEGDWMELQLPDDMDKQIAFVLQKLKNITQSSNREEIYDYTSDIYISKYSDDNIDNWNVQVLKPCFRELLIKIEDMIEDKVEGKESIDSRVLTIVNNRNIYTGDNSNIAIGQDIKQNINQNIPDTRVFEELKKIAELINDGSQLNIINTINEMKETQGTKNFKEKYNNFIQSAANHMTLYVPLLPLLTELIIK